MAMTPATTQERLRQICDAMYEAIGNGTTGKKSLKECTVDALAIAWAEATAAANEAAASQFDRFAKDLNSIAIVKFLDDPEASRLLTANVNRARALARSFRGTP